MARKIFSPRKLILGLCAKAVSFVNQTVKVIGIAMQNQPQMQLEKSSTQKEPHNNRRQTRGRKWYAHNH